MKIAPYHFIIKRRRAKEQQLAPVQKKQNEPSPLSGPEEGVATRPIKEEQSSPRGRKQMRSSWLLHILFLIRTKIQISYLRPREKNQQGVLTRYARSREPAKITLPGEGKWAETDVTPPTSLVVFELTRP